MTLTNESPTIPADQSEPVPRCPGCCHNFYGPEYHAKSVANENGYCGWCQNEGIVDSASQVTVRQQEQAEADVYRAESDSEGEYVCCGFYSPCRGQCVVFERNPN